MIPGGGIGDGAIDGVVNLYVIDDITREPIEGAEVRVGNLAGTTDATGLFVADGLVGPQDVVVKAAGHRKEFWGGVNGANVTIDLVRDLDPTPPSATLAGGITNYASVQVTAQNHVKVALISYSQTADLGDPENEITTPNDTNICVTAASAADPCNFTIVTRTGKIALFATILDVDTKGTPQSDDDSATVIAFAARTGIDTASAVGSQDLSLIADSSTQTVTVDFGTPPSGLLQHGSIVAIDLGADGVLPVGTAFTTGSSASVKVPKATALGTSYRLTTIATDGATKPAQAITLRRDLSGTSLSAGAYLAPPTGISLTRTGGSWSAVDGATVQSVELTQGATALLNVTMFDTTRTSFELPDLIVLPSGPITATVNAIGATGFDVGSFALDEDLDKIDRLGAQQTTIN